MATQSKPLAPRQPARSQAPASNDSTTRVAFFAFMALLVLALLAVGWEILSL